MGIKEFTENIAEKMQARLKGVEITPTENVKNNGVVLHGLTFRREGNNVASVLYMERWFDLFKRNILLTEEILEQVIQTYEEHAEPNMPVLENYLSSSELVKQITVHLLNLKKNRKMIEERKLVHYKVPKTDLVCLFYIKVTHIGEVSGEIVLTKDLMELYLPAFVSAEALYHEVMGQISWKDLYFKSLTELVYEDMEEKGIDAEPIPETNSLYVLGTESKIFGAMAILSEAGRRLILEQFPSGKVTVLPSSVHETLLMETTDKEDVWSLQENVKDVNRTQVEEVDFLSDNVYHFDANTGELVIATMDESEVEEE